MTTLSLYPTSDAAAGLSRTPTTPANNYGKIDEVTLDTADRVYKGVSIYTTGTVDQNATDRYGMGDHGSETAAITKVTIKAKAAYTSGYGSSPLGQIKLGLYYGTTYYWGSAQNLTTGVAEYSAEFALRPSDNAAWTWTMIDDLVAALNLRAKITAAYSEGYWVGDLTSYCYQYWIEVEYSSVQTISPSGISAATTCGAPTITITVAPSGIAQAAALGSPTVTAAGSVIVPSGIAPLTSFGTPALVQQQFIPPAGIASLTSVGTPTVTLKLKIIAPAGVAPAAALGTPALFFGHIGPVGIASALAFGALTLTRYPHHVILEAEYLAESPEINRSFVIGQDVTGASVTASAITQDEIDLVGERLEVQHVPEAADAEAAGYVAAAALAQARLDSKQATITIPPHCGLELWDVINIIDEPANQSYSYRVTGYTLEFDGRTATYHHRLVLSST